MKQANWRDTRNTTIRTANRVLPKAPKPETRAKPLPDQNRLEGFKPVDFWKEGEV